MTKDEYGDFVLRYKGCGACFPMYHTLSRFEKMWFTAIQKDVTKLEKENAELKKEWQEQVQKATDEGYARTLQTIQLTKAKEIIKAFLDSSDLNIKHKAEEFLGEF